MMEQKYLYISGVRIDKAGLKDVYNFASESINLKKACLIISINVDVLIKARKDFELKSIINNSELVLADSRILLFSSYLLGKPLEGNITGSNLFFSFSDWAAKKKYKLFLLGAASGVAEKVAEILIKKYPGLKIVGTYSPPFGFENNEDENKKMVKIIKECSPDVLFVAFGVPKQEKWIWRYKDEYNVPVSVGIGATFDYISGNVRRAPKWMQKIGLEWLFRLCQEPRRLWKRYLIGNTIFIWLVLKEFINYKFGKNL